MTFNMTQSLPKNNHTKKKKSSAPTGNASFFGVPHPLLQCNDFCDFLPSEVESGKKAYLVVVQERLGNMFPLLTSNEDTKSFESQQNAFEEDRSKTS